MEEIKFSENIKDLFSAILDFKKKVGKIYKTEENPFFKAKYADLSSVLDETDPKLTEAGLVLTCLPTGDNNMTAFLVHAQSGQWLLTTFKLNIEPSYDKEKKENKENGMLKSVEIIWRSDPYLESQKWGAAVTYGRRIAIVAILNLNVDKDNDGEKNKNNNELPWLNPGKEGWNDAVKFLKDGGDLQELFNKHQISKPTLQKLCTEADYSK
jgi:hypothetical protein